MKTSVAKAAQGIGLIPSIVLSLFVVAVISFFNTLGASGLSGKLAGWITTAYVGLCFFMMQYTGKVSRWRRFIFFAFAICLAPSFMARLIEARGSIAITATESFVNQGPMCHIVFPQALIPYLLSGDLIFPARLSNYFASFYSMLLIWVFASLTVGRGWCSWVCFYGGWDDGMSRLAGKPRLRIDVKNDSYRYFSFSMLIMIALASLSTMSAVYCQWFCPFKIVTEFEAITGILSFIATVIFILLFFSLCVVLPILTGKRTQCTAFCPFGALQSMVGKVSPYRVRIDKAKCVSCGLCAQACPTSSIRPQTLLHQTNGGPALKHGKTCLSAGLTCSLCGECVQLCPQGAIEYRLGWGRAIGPTGSRPGPVGALLSAKSIFTTSATIFGTIVAGSFMTDTIERLIRLFSTGSFLVTGGY